ncbi:hypothetical protein FQN50_007939 [Emmonsiellopsis sp. PD_5]|nr:hypothetical protein FQN50_007939 [Emmonsiellopsis sp. PD_5]
MSSEFHNLPRVAQGPLECPFEGRELIDNPSYSKGSAFPNNERTEFKLHGLLPPNIQTLDEQVDRAYAQYSSCADDLAKNTFMASMKAQNEVLFYKLLQTRLKEMFSVIYTPTEADAIENYSRIFRRPEGCFLDITEQDAIEQSFVNFGEKGEDIDYIVVTDGEEILGIGDQGVGGILISVAKLAITTICAGIHPRRQLPVVLDCGTNNEKLLNDKLYLGLRQARVRGQKYDQFVDKFVQAARKRYPPALVTALHVSKVKFEEIRVVCFGTGSAGAGIAAEICNAIVSESNKAKAEARKQIWCLDKPGLLLKFQGDKLTPAQMILARDDNDWPEGEGLDLYSVVKRVKPHVLIGTSTKPGAFTEEIIKEMAKHVVQPIVFPLSNPTRLHEAQPNDIIEWTEGRALLATGSPFPPVEYKGRKRDIGKWTLKRRAECNNSTAFPGIGLGVVLSRARLITDKMLVTASKALAAQAPALEDPNKPLLPDVESVRGLSVKVASAVIKCAVEEGLAQEEGIPNDEKELEEWIRVQMWDPEYRALKKIDRTG